RIRPLSSPCSTGFDVFGTLTSGPFRISGAITMKMISSTSTTSTRGVTLIAALIFPDSPTRIGLLSHHDLRLLQPGFLRHQFRELEQVVHELCGRSVHLDAEILKVTREVVVCNNGRDRNEDTKAGRHQRFGHTSRHHSHTAGTRRRDASESVDDSDDGSEQTDKRSRGSDRCKKPET